VVEVSGPVAIADGVQTTGSLGYQIPEQSLAIEIPGGIVVVTGCAHPGLVGICERVREIAGPGPMFVMGGFHLGEFSRADVESLVESLRAVGVRAVMPTHCTGGAARHTLKTIFGKSYLEGGAGRVLRTKEIQAALDGGD
jgi:7,8-dihydropterin-6-yl-methyl-4-(beta-D-ribofuranosyl)aminobenzene 5'-phosphate synthase